MNDLFGYDDDAVELLPDTPQLVMRFGHGPEVRNSPRVRAEELLVDPLVHG